MDWMLTESQDELLRWLSVHEGSLGVTESFFANSVDRLEWLFIAPDARERRPIRLSDLEQLRLKGLISFVERGPPASSSHPTYERIALTGEGYAYLRAPPLGIDIEPDLQEILIKMVEHMRNIPRAERGKFLLLQTFGGTSLMSLTKHKIDLDVFDGDLDALVGEGLLNLSFNAQGDKLLDVSPLGYRYYQELQKRRGQPPQRVAAAMHAYIDESTFRERHPRSRGKWLQAEKLLWSAESESQLTTIGHLCREAMQDFATELVESRGLNDVDTNKSHDVARIRIVLRSHGVTLGQTEGAFLEALLNYWGTISDLSQRQEHGSQRESAETLNWEDGRRLVFQSLNVMYEVARAVGF